MLETYKRLRKRTKMDKLERKLIKMEEERKAFIVKMQKVNEEYAKLKRLADDRQI